MANKLVTYKLQDGNGKTYTLEGPEDATDEELTSALNAHLDSIENVDSPAEPSVEPPEDGLVGSVTDTSVPSTRVPAVPRHINPSVSMDGRPQAPIQNNVESYTQNGLENIINDQPLNRPVTDEVANQYVQMWQNPSISEADIASFSNSIGRPWDEVQSQKLAAYRKWMQDNPGRDPSSELSYRNPVTEILGENWKPTEDKNVTGGVQAAWEAGLARNPVNLFKNLYQDWTDSDMGYGIDKEYLRSLYPNMTDDQIEGLQDALAGELRRRNYEQRDYQTELHPINGAADFGIQAAAGLSPLDMVPVVRGSGFVKGAADAVIQNMGIDALQQGQDVAYGTQNGFNYVQSLEQGAMGLAAHGAISTAYHAKPIVRRVSDYLKDSMSTEGYSRPTERASIQLPTETNKRTKAYREQLTQTIEGMRNHVADTIGGWKNAPEIEVHENFNNLPIEHKNALGVTLDDGTIAINGRRVLSEAKRLSVDPEHILTSLAYHEGLGHHGLAVKFGEELDGVLNRFYDHGTDTFKAEVNDWKERNPKTYEGRPDAHERAIEETIVERLGKNDKLSKSFADTITNIVKKYARQMGFNLKYSTREIKAILAEAQKGVISGKETGPVAGSNRYMYAGINSRMASWPEATGKGEWFEGPDGKDRYEINDEDSSLNLDHLQTLDEGGNVTVGDLLNHPELYKAYPEAKNIPIEKITNGNLGEYWERSPRIGLDVSRKASSIHSTLLHELQHHIQGIEDFARGGSTERSVDKMTTDHMVETLENVIGWMGERLRIDKARFEMLQEFLTTDAYRKFREADERYADTEMMKQELREDLKDQGIDPLDDPEYLDIMEMHKANIEARFQSRDAMFAEVGIPEHPSTELEYDLADYLKRFLEEPDIGYAVAKEQKRLLQTEQLLEEDLRALADGSREALKRRLNVYRGGEVDIPYQAYQAIFGEVEARDVQVRQNLSDEQRKDIKPYATQLEDNPESSWLIHRYNEPSAEKIDGLNRDDKTSLDEYRKKQYQDHMKAERLRRVTEARDILSWQKKLIDENKAEGRDPMGNKVNPNNRYMTNFKSDASAQPERMKLTEEITHYPGRAAKTFLKELGVYNNYELMHMKNNEAIQKAERLGIDHEWIDYFNDREVGVQTPQPNMSKYLPNFKYMMNLGVPDKENESIVNASEILKDVLDNYTPEHEYYSWAEARADAKAKGLTSAQIRRTKGLANLSRRVFQQEEVAQRTSERIAYLKEKINSEGVTAQNKADYLAAMFRYNELMGKIWDDHSQMARGLAALRSIQHTRKNYGRLNEMLSEMANQKNGLAAFASDDTFKAFTDQVDYLMSMGNQKGVNNLVSSIVKPYWWQYALTFRHSMMLSGIGTHYKNALDNAMMIARELEEKAMAMPGALLRSGMNRVGMKVQEGVTPQELAGHMYGLLRAAFDSQTYMDSLKAFRDGHGNRALSSKVEMGDAHIPVISKVQDALHASDTFFRAFHDNANLYTLGVREARKRGFTGVDALSEGSDIAANPTKELLEEARRMSDVSLLVDKPSWLMSKLEAVKAIRPGMNGFEQAGVFAANLLFPFFRVTDRLLFQKLRRIPVANLLDRVTREDIAAGGPRRDIAIARAAFGGMLLWYYWDQAGDRSKIEGQGPEDYLKRESLEAGGYKPNSTIEDGKYRDASALNLSWLPSDLNNSVAANIASIRQAYDAAKSDGADTGTLMATAYHTILSVLSSQTFAENLSQYMGDPNQKAGESTAEANIAGGIASSFVPAAVRQYNQGVNDPYQRDTSGDKTFADRVKGRVMSGIPGMSDDLPMKYDALGDPKMQGRSLSGADNTQTIKTDPIAKEISRLDRGTSKPVLRSAPSSFKHEGETVRLNAEAKQEWQRVQGYYIRTYMKEEMSDPSWKTLSDAEKRAIIDEVGKDAYNDTKDYMLPLLGLSEDTQDTEGN